jgi:putative hydroxymethylpyrimidine transport system substrate-binding protein
MRSSRGFLSLIAFLMVLAFAGHSELTVCLDFFPNPNHVPLYAARELGWFAEEHLGVDIVVPANVSDPLKLVAARQFDVALTPQINYLIALSEGLPLIAVGALIDRNLGGLLSLTASGIEELDDLRGKKIGYSLAPLEPILWETMLAYGGVGIDEVELVNVGYNTVVALMTGSVDAIGAFRNYEVFQVELLGQQTTFFPQEDHGIPDTYDILIVCHPELMVERDAELQTFLAILARGVEQTKTDPEQAYSLFLQANTDLDDALNRLAFDATVPLFAAGLRHDCAPLWMALQDYLLERGIVERAFELDRLYSTALLPGEEEE